MIDPPYRAIEITDRLGDLLGNRGLGAGGSRDNELGAPVAHGPVIMQDFFDDARDLKEMLERISSNMRLIEEAHSGNLTTISTEEGRQYSDTLDGLTQTTNGIVAHVRNGLKAMDTVNKEHAARYKGTAQGATESRIRTNMHNSLARKYVNLVQAYQDLQKKYKGKYKERVERQYRILKPNATQEEVERSVEDPRSDVFAQQIAGHAAARNALADIQDRHKDILRLETSINELHQLFLDMSVIVESQGELLDSIEYTVGQTVTNTGSAIEELRKANEYKAKKRSYMCWAVGVGVIIFVIIFMPIFVDVIDDD